MTSYGLLSTRFCIWWTKLSQPGTEADLDW